MANSEWPTVALGDVADIFTGFPFKSNDYVENPSAVKLLRGDNVAQGVLRWDGVKRWPIDQVELVRSYLLEAEDVILAMDRPWIEAGLKFAKVREHDLPVLLVQRVTRLRGSERLDTSFLYYVIASQEFTSYVLAVQTGTAVPHISTGQIKAFRFVLPLPDDQRRIAHILGTLDDKIELNRQLNATLEQLARTLFQSWFVDFDPVRAKASGEPEESICRRLGLAPELLARFPAALEDSAMGEIPAGWTASSIDEEFNLIMGQSPPGDTYNSMGDGLPFYQGRTDFGFRFPTHRIYCTAPTRFASIGDTLISVRAPVGDINMANERCAIGRGVAAARHKSGSRIYTYEMMRNLKPKFDSFNGEGTVFGSINKKAFYDMKCMAPDQSAIEAFDKMLAAVEISVENNELESRTLATLRDELLPKLLSGDLCLS